jgi:hypothetical protein
MRVYGRLYAEDGSYTWVVRQTNSINGNADVFLTALVQCLNLNLNESPFYANAGIPAQPSIVQQLFPDFYVSLTQQRYSPYFANLIVSKLPTSTPTYDINATLQNGQRVTEIAV